MTETTYTPGPWKIDTHAGLQIWGSPGYVCKIPLGDCRSPARLRKIDANARLIAAAPDLLAALKLCESFCKGHQETPEKAARYQQVCAAIAKAEGTS